MTLNDLFDHFSDEQFNYNKYYLIPQFRWIPYNLEFPKTKLKNRSSILNYRKPTKTKSLIWQTLPEAESCTQNSQFYA